MADSKSGAMTKQVLSLWDFADIFADFPQGHVFCLSKPFSEPKIWRDVQLFAAFPRRRDQGTLSENPCAKTILGLQKGPSRQLSVDGGVRSVAQSPPEFLP
jgi:hypothetical protein